MNNREFQVCQQSRDYEIGINRTEQLFGILALMKTILLTTNLGNASHINF